MHGTNLKINCNIGVFFRDDNGEYTGAAEQGCAFQF
jgi:hypothetical protein